jgi:hypothetical protein
MNEFALRGPFCGADRFIRWLNPVETLDHRELNDFVMVDALVPAHRRVERTAVRVVVVRVIDAASADPHRSVQQRRSCQLDDRLPERRTEHSFDFSRLL